VRGRRSGRRGRLLLTTLEVSGEYGRRKGDTYVDLRKEALGRAQRGREIRITRHDDQGVAGPQVQELKSLDSQRDVGLLLLFPSMVFPQ
jgi:hypothetical protein